MNQELWLNLDRSRPHERIVWLISPKSSKKLKKDDLVDFDGDFGDAGSFTEILGITVILTNAPASNCVSELLQSLLRVTYISDASKKEKNIRREEEGALLAHCCRGTVTRRSIFFFYPKCKARTVGPHLLNKRIIDKKNFKKTNV